jgi:hypothetical protein
MRILVMLILAFPLAGCIEDQAKQAATCQVNGTHAFPNQTLRGSAPSIDLADYLQACMRKEGYVFICDYQNLSGLATCYEPAGTFAKWTFSLEQKLRNSD